MIGRTIIREARAPVNMGAYGHSAADIFGMLDINLDMPGDLCKTSPNPK